MSSPHYSHVTIGSEIEKGSKAFQGQIKGFRNLVTVYATEQNLLCLTSALHLGMILAIFLVYQTIHGAT